jgi:hypothetical protein
MPDPDLFPPDDAETTSSGHLAQGGESPGAPGAMPHAARAPEPLAERVRPRALEDLVGQEAALGAARRRWRG